MILSMQKKFKHLSINERYKIKEMQDKGMCVTEIAEGYDRNQMLNKESIEISSKRNKLSKYYQNDHMQRI